MRTILALGPTFPFASLLGGLRGPFCGVDLSGIRDDESSGGVVSDL